MIGIWIRQLVVTFWTNKAGYTATLVACWWAGAVLEKVTKVTKASGQELYAKKAQNRQKKVKRGPTDRPTDQPTDQHSGV